MMVAGDMGSESDKTNSTSSGSDASMMRMVSSRCMSFSMLLLSYELSDMVCCCCCRSREVVQDNAVVSSIVARGADEKLEDGPASYFSRKRSRLKVSLSP